MKTATNASAHNRIRVRVTVARRGNIFRGIIQAFQKGVCLLHDKPSRRGLHSELRYDVRNRHDWISKKMAIADLSLDKELVSAFKRQQVLFAIYRRWEHAAFSLLALLVNAVLLITTIFALVLVFSAGQHRRSTASITLALAGELIGVLPTAGWTYIYLTMRRAVVRLSTAIYMYGLAILSLGEAILAYTLFLRLSAGEPMRGVLYVAAITSAVSGSLLLLGSRFIPWILNVVYSQKRRKIPDVCVCRTLFRALLVCEDPRFCYQPFRRKQVIACLEYCALCIERYFPVFMHSQNAELNIGYRLTTARQAAWLRSFEPWLLTPQSDTRQVLAMHLRKLFVSLVKGNWHELPQLSSHNTTRLVRVRAMCGEWIKAILISALPALILVGVQHTPYPFEKNVFQYASLAAILWALVNLAASLEPRLDERASRFKFFVDLFTPWKKGAD